MEDQIPEEVALEKITEALNTGATYLDLSCGNVGIGENPHSHDVGGDDLYISLRLSDLPPAIGQLEKLTKLDLSENKLTSLPFEFSRLENLTELILSHNQLTTIPKEIYKLGKLRKLILNGNEISELPKEIGELNLLLELDVSNNKLTSLPPEISKLTNIKKLRIGQNPIKEIPAEINQLKKLIILDLSGRSITAQPLPEEMEKFAEFFSTDYKITPINSFPIEICGITNLRTLFLSYNQLSSIPSQIGDLVNLQHLVLNDNLLSSLPHSISHLSKLEILIASNNQITTLPDEIGRLENLISLDLSDNQINIISTAIEGAFNLKKLYLSNNKITSLPKEIGNLVNLAILVVANNNIKALPHELGRLINLEIFSITHNQISSLPSEIGQLHKLAEIYLSQNRIVSLPREIADLRSLKKLALLDNLLGIPPEILDKVFDPKVILDYYFADKRRLLNELKMIFVGQPAVGKTSLIQQMLYSTFDQKQTKTVGISIESWQYSDVKLNIWDFGGQEIMHATHQFFLTKRSLYLLVLDSHLTQEENRVEYWLKIIQSFGGESPVLIVGNKIDQHPLDIDRTGLQKKYPNVVGILETSAATGAGIEELKAAITEQVSNLPHVRDLLPETWFTVKTKLEELGKQSNFITHDKYLELCAENEVSDETSQRTLIGFLHDLGVVLHFQDDPRLEALGILNPQWVTNGVYKILNSHALFQNKGVLTTSMLDEILNLPEYPRGKRLFIVDMMKKFELCYDIEPDKTFLVPDLLPKDQPDLNFNGVPAFEYAYPVLPSSVITRFIVRMNQKIDDGFVWRTGVVLKIGENKALVKADIEDRKITIAIDGVEHTRRDALSAIRFQLDEIHASIKGLNPEKFVPIPGAESQRYEFLLQLEHDGVKILPVPAKSGGKPIMVDISQLLSGIESEAQRRENVTNVTTIYHVNTGGGDFTGGDKSISAGDSSVVVGGNMSGNLISGNYNKINSAEIAPELKETLLQLGEAVNTMLQKLPAEQATEIAEDYGKLADEAVKPKPNKKWYSVSIEGLIKAAENLDKLGTPVISLSRKVLSLLTGGV